jgi:hypothetical protein
VGLKRGAYLELVVPLTCGHVLTYRTLLSGAPKYWVQKTYDMMVSWAESQHQCKLVDEDTNPNGLPEPN